MRQRLRLFGAGVRVHWLRQGTYADQRHVHLARARRRPGRPRVADAHRADRPARAARRSPTRPAPAPPRRRTRAGRRGAASAPAAPSRRPAGRYIQYRATLTRRRPARPPTLQRVAITYGAGANARARTRARSPSRRPRRRTNQTSPRRSSGFSDPDGDPLTYHYRWLRNGTADPRRDRARTLDLVAAGNGDRGDKVRVEVYATDGRGAASDAAVRDRDGGQHRADRRHRDDRARRRRRPTTSSRAVPHRLLRRRRRRAHLPLPVAAQRHADRRRDGPRRSTSRWRATATSATASTSTSPRVDAQRRPRARRARAASRHHRHELDPGRRAPSALAPAAPRTDQTLTATPHRLPRPGRRRRSRTRYRWLRNGTADRRRHRPPRSTSRRPATATAATRSRVEVTATRHRTAARARPATGSRHRGQQRTGRRAR